MNCRAVSARRNSPVVVIAATDEFVCADSTRQFTVEVTVDL